MAAVQFKSGSYLNYQGLATKDAGTIYFCEDTLQIFKGSVEYTKRVFSGTTDPTGTTYPVDSLFVNTTTKAVHLFNGTAWSKVGNLVTEVKVDGDGNVITGYTFINGVLTLTKGINAATSGELLAHTSADNPHGITPAGIGAYTKKETEELIAEMQTEAGAHTHDNKIELDKFEDGDKAKWDAHVGNTDNPHSVTKVQVGLGNVDNTSDMDKPVSTAQEAAIKVAKDAADAALEEAQKRLSGVKEGEKVISVTGTEIGTTLSLTYDENTKKIKLLGIGDAVVAELDATAFIKDGMLAGATYDADADKLILSFNTDAGKEDIEVPLSDLVYTAGNGINIANNVISVKVKADDPFLTVDSNGLHTTEELNTQIYNAEQAAKDYADSQIEAFEGSLGGAAWKSVAAAVADNDDLVTGRQVKSYVDSQALEWGTF